MSQHKLDPCLFTGEKIICISSVDDLLFLSKEETHIHILAILLCQASIDLEKEDDAMSGLQEMKQECFIDHVIKALELDGGTLNEKATPVEGKPLAEDIDREVACDDFSNSSVVGMCLYFFECVCANVQLLRGKVNDFAHSNVVEQCA